MYIILTSQIISIGVTRSKLPSSPLAGRDFILLQNVGTGTIYIGNSVVTANTANTGGYQLLSSGEWIAGYESNVDIYGVMSAGSGQILIQEGK